jgi:hypothetical protein
MVLIGQTQEIGEIDMPPSKKGKKKGKKTVSWEDFYGNQQEIAQKVEVKSEGDIVLTPWKLRMFEKCNTRLMDIYDKVIKEQQAKSVEMSNRLIAKLRGTTMGGA